MEPLASSILLTLELYVALMAEPIHKDTPVPSHAMPYTFTASVYTQSSFQLTTSVTLLSIMLQLSTALLNHSETKK